jgi:hypothetical protein
MIKTFIHTWIYAKLEYITGSLCGISVITFDLPSVLLKILMALVLGAAGGLGSHGIKILLDKFTKNEKKRK